MTKLPASVGQCIRQLGESLRTARIRRRLSQKDLAALMQVSIGTVQRLERGDPGVSIGNIAMAFLCLSSLDKLAKVLEPSADEIGNAADRFRQPQRVRSSLIASKTAVQHPDDEDTPMSF